MISQKRKFSFHSCLRNTMLAAMVMSTVVLPNSYNAGGIEGQLNIATEQYGTSLYKLTVTDDSGNKLNGYECQVSASPNEYTFIDSETIKLNTKKPVKVDISLEGLTATTTLNSQVIFVDTPLTVLDEDMQPVSSRLVSPSKDGDVYVELNNKVTKVLSADGDKYRPLQGLSVNSTNTLVIR